MYFSLHLRCVGAAAVATLTISHALVSAAPSQCEQVLSRFGDKLIDATCADSADLTTANLATTPANNAIATLPPFAFTPQADRDTIAPDPPHRTPIAGPVPGVQINARIAEDPQGQARVLIRLPDNWNGRLVVAGASGTRSEFNGDFAWSDYVVQKGYAYVAQNKGTLNLRTTIQACPSHAGPPLWQKQPGSGAPPSRSRHLERRLPGATCRGVLSGAVRRRGRLGRHLRG